MYLVIATVIIGLIMASTMIIIRAKVAKRPTNTKRILLPPVFMSTGAFMFVFPQFRVSTLEIAEAILVGMFFSIFLIKSTDLEIIDQEIYLKPSKYFIAILVGLLIVRLGLKWIVGSHISLGETSGIFFLLALGMIVTWRIAMYFKYRRLMQNVKLNQ
ncbi:CcdC family protein [Paraliobacillus ryukyuensis]|uniref:CcdC family protein n=1 Tax=Paraliobacillus ryukyuensis TaxID=200904 RepID=UPI0009A8B2F5|nr:cytochrome c biogenesis protein CcdC [Paraliobacillus ryukyuensis]